ncbi:MAG: hypothetical protein ACOX87_11970 [Chloroflexota bacterium]|jgi:hypothetical protein
MLKQRFGLHVCTRLVVEKAVWATGLSSTGGVPNHDWDAASRVRWRAGCGESVPHGSEKNHAVLVNVVTQMQNSHVVTLQRSSSVRFPRR